MNIIQKRRILLDAGSSTLQVIVAAITLFFLYRYLLRILGPSDLGVWSLVVATSSLVQIANFGLAGSIVKQVAEFDADKDYRQMGAAVETAVIAMAGFCLVITLLAYPLGKWYLAFAIQGDRLALAIHLLPIALVAFWIMMVSSIYQGALYGCNMIVARNSILVGESIVYLLLSFWFARRHGLVGLMYARLLQNFITLSLSVAAVRWRVPTLSIIPRHWRTDLFKVVFGYAAQLQLISLMVLLCDPLTKGFLSRYGSTALVGYYEMANRLIQQFRSLLVGANQVLVPVIARLNKAGRAEIDRLYDTTYQLMFFVSWVGFTILMAGTPLICEIWLGRYEPSFVVSLWILSIGWLLNCLSLPAYNSSLGSGWLRGNLISHVIMFVLNVSLCLLLGRLLGGPGVVLAWSIALGIGALALCTMYLQHTQQNLINLLPTRSVPVLLWASGGLSFALVLHQRISPAVFHAGSSQIEGITSTALGVSTAVLTLYLLWLIVITRGHPVRNMLIRFVCEGFQRMRVSVASRP